MAGNLDAVAGQVAVLDDALGGPPLGPSVEARDEELEGGVDGLVDDVEFYATASTRSCGNGRTWPRRSAQTSEVRRASNLFL